MNGNDLVDGVKRPVMERAMVTSAIHWSRIDNRSWHDGRWAKLMSLSALLSIKIRNGSKHSLIVKR